MAFLTRAFLLIILTALLSAGALAPDERSTSAGAESKLVRLGDSGLAEQKRFCLKALSTEVGCAAPVSDASFDRKRESPGFQPRDLPAGRQPSALGPICLKGELSRMRPRLYKALSAGLLMASALSCGAGKSGSDDSLSKTREAILKEDLLQMRKMIDQYAADQGHLPQSLDDLVKGGYLHQLPEDPITRKTDWKLVIVEDPNSKGKRALTDIHSSSSEKSTEGKPYNEW